jgi:DNA-binding FrmR family transcriptional regulator
MVYFLPEAGTMTKTNPSHLEDLGRLKKIEGQIKGVQKMIQDGRYCIDILTQLSSVVGAIKSVEENIINRHLRTCVAASLLDRSPKEKEKKVQEIIDVLVKFRKHE